MKIILFARKIKYILFQRVRKWYYKKTFESNAKSVGLNLKVNSKSNATRTTIIRDNVTINGITIGGEGRVIFESNCRVGRDTLIITSNHNYYKPQKLPYDDKLITKDVIIKENVWIGQSVIILPGVTIGEGAVIQAGSVVVRDVPKFAVVGGNPANVFKYRDIDHYLLLKKVNSTND